MNRELINKNIKLELNDETLPIVKQIAEGLPGGFFIYKATGDGEILFVNSAMLKIFGCENVDEFMEMTGGTFSGMIHPDDLDEIKSSIDNQISANRDRNDYVEYRIIRKDFSIRWIVDYGSLVHTEKYGDLFYVFIDDATEKHLKELEQKKYESIIEALCSAYNSVYLVDFEWNSMVPFHLQYVVSERMLKYIQETNDVTEIFNEYIKHYIVPKDVEFFKREVDVERIKERLTTEKAYSVNFHRYDDYGKIQHIQMYIARVEGEHGIMHAVLGFRNIGN